MHHPSPRHTALLIIDMQNGLFHGPERPHAPDSLLENIQQLIGKARSAGAPIFCGQTYRPTGLANCTWQPKLATVTRVDAG